MMYKRILFFLIILALSLSACQAISPQAGQPPEGNATASLVAASIPTTETPPAGSPVPSSAPSQAASAAPGNIGPDLKDIPAGYNPLTGQPAADPATLKLPAVLVSITNFPPSARPQAGLSFSPWVFEIYIAEGMTRYLAAFYGDLPKPVSSSAAGEAPKADPGIAIGPVRSGRLAYVPIRDFYQDSCLVYASATAEIRSQLRGCAMVFGSDARDINSAMLDATRLQKIAEENQRGAADFNYSGNLFSANPPAQGAPASQLDIYYSFLNQAQWQYDQVSAAYLKFDDFADGSGKFTPATDRLTGNQLAFSNVVVLFSEHTALKPYIIDIKMGMGQHGKAIIFRDGQVYTAAWSTVAGEYEQTTGLRRPLRLEDASGQPFALKPGHTWVHVVTPASEVQDKGGGLWNLRFYAPAGAK